MSRKVIVLIWAACLVTGIPATFADSPLPEPAVEEGGALLDHLRRIDRQLQRWERQLAHPRGVGPTDGELERLADHLRRLAPEASKVEPETAATSLERKRRILVRATSTLLASLRGESTKQVTHPERNSSPALPPSWLAENVGHGEAAGAACDSALRIEPGHWSLGRLDGVVWLRFIAPESGWYRLDTRGSRTDTKARIQRGCSSAAAILEANDDGFRLQASARFHAAAGETLHVRLDSASASELRVGLEKTGSGSISGTVSGSTDGEPLSGIGVVLIDTSGLARSDYTAWDGSYSFDGLDDGVYTVYTRAYDDWLNQAWEGIRCGLGGAECRTVEKTPIKVQSGSASTDVDFVLTPGAIVRGTATDAVSGEPVGDAIVEIYDEAGEFVSSTHSDSSGFYEAGALMAGSYRLTARHSEFFSELFSEIPCAIPCDAASGDPVVLSQDEVESGITFTLDPLASISGQVSHDGQALAYASVQVFEAGGSWVKSVYTDVDGLYRAGGLEAGEYRVAAEAPGYAREFRAETLVLGDGESRVGIDFELEALGSLVGTVRVADTSLEVTTAGRIGLYSSAGDWRDEAWIVSGSYEFLDLPSADYFAWARVDLYRPEVWSDHVCWTGRGECDVTQGDGITILPETETRADFELSRLGAIEGTVTDAQDGSAITGVEFRIYEGDGTSNGYSTSVTAADGTYRVEGLRPGSYLLVADHDAYLNEVWDDVVCAGSSCDPTVGTPISVELEATVPGVDYALVPKGRIEATVTDAETSSPVDQGRVVVYDDQGIPVLSEYFSDGSFVLDTLETGDYFVEVESEEIHLSQVWKDNHCLPSNCGDPTSGTSITVADGTVSALDVVLQRTATVEGVVETSDGGDLGVGQVVLYDEVGKYHGSGSVSGSKWSIGRLAPGTYYALASSYHYRDQLYEGIDCEGGVPNCDPLSGAPIVVGLGETKTGIGFLLEAKATLVTRIVDARTGEELAVSGGVTLSAENGATSHKRGTSPFTFQGLVPDTYRITATSFDGYLSQVLGGDVCDPICDTTVFSPISIQEDTVEMEIDVPLMAGPGVRARIVDGANGGSMDGVGLDVWNPDGQVVAAAGSDEDGWLEVLLYPGTYYLSTETPDGEENELWRDIACQGGSAFSGACDPLDGTPFEVEYYEPLREITIVIGEHLFPLLTDDFESGDLTFWSHVEGDGTH